MTDYGHDLQFGAFLTPSNSSPQDVVGLAVGCERAGLDLVTFQDHPYQASLLDSWMLLSFVAARTERVHLAPNVANLPLRKPAVVARAAASLDLLSGGRYELGLGAGVFWDAIEAVGGTRLAPGQAVAALGEAIEIIRAIWDADAPTAVQVDGTVHRVDGAERGPRPAHDIEIWVGAYQPRLVRLTGRLADGWLPSLPFLGADGAVSPAEGNEIIDAAALDAGRTPQDVRRLANIVGSFGAGGDGPFTGPPTTWAEQLTELTLTQGFSTYILVSDDADDLARFAQEVAPAAREAVAAERAATRA